MNSAFSMPTTSPRGVLRRRWAPALALSALLSGVGLPAAGTTTPAAAADVSSTWSSEPVRTWSPMHTTGVKSKSLTQAVADAKAFDVITAHPNVYKPYVRQMHQANPNLRLLVYTNAVFTWRRDLAESSYSHDARGRRISPHEYRTTYMMNPSSSGWRSFAAQQARTLLQHSGYDGVYVDVLGPASLSTGYVSAAAINPTTGKPWTVGPWLQATAAIASHVKAAVGSRPVFGNGLSSGPQYFDGAGATSVLAGANVDVIGGESWLRAAKTPIGTFRPEAEWKKDVDMIVDIQRRGKSAAVLTKVWVTGSAAQKQQWHEYSLASFLLATNGRSLYEFQYTLTDATVRYPWNDVVLGTASSGYSKTGNVYQRSFSAGRVLVNPSRSVATVALGGTYTTLKGQRVSTVTLAPNTGMVLRRG